MKRRTVLLIFVVICLCAGSVVLWYQSAPSPTQKAIQKVLDDPTTETLVKQQKNLPQGLDEFIAWYVPRVKNASPEVQALMKEYDAKFRGADAIIHMALEEMFPTDEWLQRYLDMGAEISDFSDYSGFLNARWEIYHAKNEEDGLRKIIDFYEIAPDASWEDVIKTSIQHGIRLNTLTDSAMAADDDVYGGSLSIDGVFTPIRHKTVYVNVTPKPHGGGVSLCQAVAALRTGLRTQLKTKRWDFLQKRYQRI